MHPLAGTRFDALDSLRAAVEATPAAGLEPDTYARDHAAFEARSDQRARIAAWLLARRSLHRPGPVSVCAVGCGDGALDSSVADVLVRRAPDRRVRYVGVEPFAGSAEKFAGRMRALDHDSLSTDVVVAPFSDTALDEAFDVVTFVHSMYYVPDVAEAATTAVTLLADGGEVLVLSAPRGALNQLAGVLAPSVEGHRQWFSDDVRGALASTSLRVDEAGTIDAVVDLTDADDDVLDFTVQARLTAPMRELVRTYLARVSTVEGRVVVPHPVDTYVVRAS